MSSCCQRAVENGFAADDGPSLETGAVLDVALSVNYCANCDSVSVRVVREKCDEKGTRPYPQCCLLLMLYLLLLIVTFDWCTRSSAQDLLPKPFPEFRCTGRSRLWRRSRKSPPTRMPVTTT